MMSLIDQALLAKNAGVLLALKEVIVTHHVKLAQFMFLLCTAFDRNKC